MEILSQKFLLFLISAVAYTVQKGYFSYINDNYYYRYMIMITIGHFNYFLLYSVVVFFILIFFFFLSFFFF